jgi:hypothetical protein
MVPRGQRGSLYGGARAPVKATSRIFTAE